MKFADLKKQVSIKAILNEKGLSHNFVQRGDRFIGPCPIHGGDNPTGFVISLSKNHWYCFTRCGRGGDVVELVRLLDNTDYRQVARYLTSFSNSSTIPKVDSAIIPSPNVFRPYRYSVSLDSATDFFHKKSISSSTAKRFETGAYYGKGFLNQCIGVRLHDLSGRPIGYAGRRLDADQIKKFGKWKFPKNLPKNQLLYNYHRIVSLPQSILFVVECPWGVMRLSQLDVPAIALLGVHASISQFNILKKYRRIVIMLDGDAAGRKATPKLLGKLKGSSEVEYVILPTGIDPDDLPDTSLLKIVKVFF